MDLEDIVQQILLSRRDLTRDEVLKRIYEKKRSAQDYFLDEVAAHIVAVELGVEIENEQEPFQSEIAIKDLVSGLNNVTILGRVVAVYPPQTFLRNDTTQGKVARLLMTDGTGTLKLVLWDNDVELIEKGQVKQGQIVKILHAYVRESFDGTLELHLGKRAEVEISPKGVDESRFPHTAADLVERIRQITPAKRRASVQGLVTSMFPTSEFKRRDGTGGKVKRVRLRDETGEITIVLWNEKADELSTINEGDQLRITNTRVKQGLDGRLELHVENSSQIEKTASQTPSQPVLAKMPYKVVNLTEGGSFTVEGIVASTPLIREVTTSKGENVLLATFDLVDETGAIPVTLWRNHAEFARQLELGTRIRIENAYAKKGFSDPLELTSRSATTIEIAPQPEEEQTENKIE